MSMDGIDVSGWQSGIDLSAVPADFVICKATQGTAYTSPDFARQAEQVLASGKLLGAYHYVGGSGAAGEADHFLDVVSAYLGRAVLCLDWESEQNSRWGDEGYLEAVVERVVERSGVVPMIYASLSAFPWELAARHGCGCWVAQYANYSVTGYQESPWNEGAYACAIRQYSSAGRLSGYSGSLDLDKAYMDAGAWARYASPGGVGSSGATDAGAGGSGAAVAGTTLELACAVMRGEYGVGAARKAALGSRYDEVQALVNHVCTADAATLAAEVWAGAYGDGETRRAILSERYDEVRAAVNATAAKSVDQLAREVINGDWGNGAERRSRLAAAGYDYAAVQARVNQMLA